MNPTLQKLFSTSWMVMTLLTCIAIGMRFFSFFVSVIDHDESTYILIADELVRGRVYLRDVIDTKPIGIFLLFASFQVVFGKTILAIRLITSVWIALTGWILFLTHRRFLRESSSTGYNPAPFASGLIYVVITSLFGNYGVAPNTEVFFNLFTITALFMIVRRDKQVFFFIAGLLLGIGFMIKYVVLMDATALVLFFVGQQWIDKKSWRHWVSRGLLMGFGFIVPFMLTWGYYRLLGLEEMFLFYSFELSGRYIVQSDWMEYVDFLRGFFLRFLPVMLLFFYCIWDWRSTGPRLVALTSIWGIFVITVILLPGRMFEHYFIQFMLPLSLLSGSFFDSRRSLGRFLSWIRNPVLISSALLVILIVNGISQKTKYYDPMDFPREVAAYLNTLLKPGDILYTGDYENIVYILTNTSSPTPFMHASLIWKKENNVALRINPDEEFQKIINQQPKYILMRFPLMSKNPLIETLKKSYKKLVIFEQEVIVFERVQYDSTQQK